MSERTREQTGHWPELDAATREARLAAKLRANLARRKQQVRARQDGESREGAAGKAAPAAPALDREDGAA